MSNKWNIPDWLEEKVKKRDKFCIYCDIKMKEYPHTKGTPNDKATWEHFDNNEHNIKEWNLALCCGSCNSSKGAKSVRGYIEYCKERGRKLKLGKPVKDYLKRKSTI